jgi:hypothetical protein
MLALVPEPPGDPAALSKGATTYTAAHGELERDRAALTSATGQASGPTWSGLGAGAYVTAANNLAAAYALICSALAKGASTLSAYSLDLATAKQTTRSANNAINSANSLASALLSAQTAAEGADRSAEYAATTAANAETLAAASPLSPTAKAAATTARSTANQAQSTAADAWNGVNTLQQQYDVARSVALTLTAEAEQQASQAVSKASAGFEAAGVDLMGPMPTPAKGGAHGVTGDGSSTWDNVVANLATWNDHAGWLLNSWGAFGMVVTARAEAQYLGAASDLKGPAEAEEAAFDEWFAGGGGYFKWNATLKTYNPALSAERSAFSDLRESIVPGKGLMGAFGKVGLVAGMGSDVITEIAPAKSFGPDGLLGGNTDRVMAGLNFAGSAVALGGSLDVTLATTALAIPGVNIIVGGVLIGTAIYFGGEFVYEHWHGITHSLRSAADWVGGLFS